MFRPRASHDLRVLATDLEVSSASSVRMIQDPHSNLVALVPLEEEAGELRIVCSFTIEHAADSDLQPGAGERLVSRLCLADDGDRPAARRGHPVCLRSSVRPAFDDVAKSGVTATAIEAVDAHDSHDSHDSRTIAAGYTRSWLQACLPGACWLPFDPTNNLIGGPQLIRVGVARDPTLAAPVSGVWYGQPTDHVGLTVDVTVQRR